MFNELLRGGTSPLNPNRNVWADNLNAIEPEMARQCLPSGPNPHGLNPPFSKCLPRRDEFRPNPKSHDKIGYRDISQCFAQNAPISQRHLNARCRLR